ncbi:MAG: hypothetical protein ABFC57_17690 [Veillonellales bacterium]
MKWLRYIVPLVALVVTMTGITPDAEAGAVSQQFAKNDFLKLPEWAVTASGYGGKLLLSDSPETVTADGIMYQDTVKGDARLFFHHVNGTDKPKKIVVLLENTGTEPVHITVSQYGLGGPGLNYLAVGKTAQMAYLKGGDLYLVEVSPQGTAELAVGLSSIIVEPNALVNGIYDFSADQPVKVKTIMLPVNEDIEKFAAQAKVLPADQYKLRGTFDNKDRLLVPVNVYNAKDDGMVAVTLADNKIDRYVKGVDATDGSQVLNYGNYGVVYKLFIPSSALDNKLSCYLNPRGGEYAGGLGVKYRYHEQPVLATPSDRLSFGVHGSTDAAFIGAFDGGQSLWLTFSPPGASNLPVKLVIAPGLAAAVHGS